MKHAKLGVALCVATLCLSLTSCSNLLEDILEKIEEEISVVSDLSLSSEEDAEKFLYGKWECVNAGTQTSLDEDACHIDEETKVASSLKYITIKDHKVIIQFSKPLPVEEYINGNIVINGSKTELSCDFNSNSYHDYSGLYLGYLPYQICYEKERGEYFSSLPFSPGRIELYGIADIYENIKRVDYILFYSGSLTYELKKIE